jgi:cell division initiation protein
MKITPLEIRQKDFEKVFRGYDKDEVNAYLLSLSQEWERVLEEKRELKMKLEATDREVQKLREVESSLFKALKTAEETGANMIEQANRNAELHLRETQMKAEAIMIEAKSKARAIIEEADYKSRAIIEEMEDELKHMEQTYRVLENTRDNLMSELRNFANDTLERVERFSSHKSRKEVDATLKKAKTISKVNTMVDEDEIKVNKNEGAASSKGKSEPGNSFFDNIE